MNTFYFYVINAVTLIVVALVGYLGSETPSVTALIPVFAGLLLLTFVKGFKSGNKTIAHIVVVITFLTLLALFKPLSGAISRNDSAATIRVLLMILTGIIAMAAFIKSFIDARKNRKAL